MSYAAGDFQSGVSLSGNALTGNSKWNTNITPNGNYVVLKYESDSAVTGVVHKGTVIVDATNKTVLVPLDGNANVKLSNNYQTVTIGLSGVTKENPPATSVDLHFANAASGDATIGVAVPTQPGVTIATPGSDGEWGWNNNNNHFMMDMVMTLASGSSLIGKSGKLSFAIEDYAGQDYSNIELVTNSELYTPNVVSKGSSLYTLEFDIDNLGDVITISSNVMYLNIYDAITSNVKSKFVY